MKTLGLIVEYNPFHNGHLYHLEQSKALSGAEYVACVMSGNFIQRGEPALINKWARAKMALLSGVDLVIELPVVYAMSSAEFFAFGAVKLLDSLGIVDNICFGSESGEIKPLDIIADVLADEPDEYKYLLKEQLDTGLSYPEARVRAMKAFFDSDSSFTGNVDSLMGASNNILGIEYLKAIKRLKSKIAPLTIQRVNNTYNSTELSGRISSATSIRKHIQQNGIALESSELKRVLPDISFSVLEEEFESGRGPLFQNNFENIIFSELRRIPPEQLKALPYIAEGLENRIKSAADNSGSLQGLLDRTATKRYTATRIQRILFSLLTGLSAHEFNEFNNAGGPQYIRVLGFNQKGRLLLKELSKSARLPLIVKTADYKHTENRLVRRMLEIEALATDLYVLGYSNPEYRKAGQEFTQNIIRI